MTSSGQRKRSYVRRFLWLGIAIAAVVTGYTVAWNYAAGFLVERVNAGVASVNTNGRRANCENAEARGYPFRIGIFCQSVLFEDAREGVGLRARAFRSAAQVYAPARIVAELDGPATIQAPGIDALDIDWSLLRASARLAAPLPERLSVEASDVTVAPDQAGSTSQPLARASSVEAHMRPAGDDLDLALRFAGLALDRSLTGAAALPALDGLADLSIDDGVSVPLAGARPLRGRSGTIRTISLSIDDDTGATLSGPVSVDDLGLVDAELEVTLRNPAALAKLLGELMPDSRQEIDLAFSALSAMGEAPTLPLRIVKGDMSLGFLSLGSIPPL